jgi:uncharacterized protein (TIGR02145 family)
MKTKIFLTLMAFALLLSAFAQKPTIDLSFTAIYQTFYLKLDSIKIINRTQEANIVLVWPDTVIVLDYETGVSPPSNDDETMKLFQNYPNPVGAQTTVSMFVPAKDNVSIMVTDILGRMILKSDILLEKGFHSFLFSPGESNLYFFYTQWRGIKSSIKIIKAGQSNQQCSLTYIGSSASSQQFKAKKDIMEFPFSLGDKLLFIGYADGLQSGIVMNPDENKTYTFQFATNIPCLGTPTVEYEGQTYNTIQVFSQCWLKENLNVGTMIPGYQNQTNNGTIEKYCYNNEPDSCTNKGGLYQWNEMMKYNTQEGAQGICPDGWHLPTHEEWKVLEGAADSFYGIGDPEWDMNEGRGFDAGTNLKSESGWSNGTDQYGFSGLPVGWRDAFDYTFALEDWGLFWTSSTSIDGQWGRYRVLVPNWVGVYAAGCNKSYGYSVRCIKDE